jgi:hypothetical protein
VKVHVRIHLNGGQTVDELVDGSLDAVIGVISQRLSPPHWERIGSSLIHTHAISGIEFDEHGAEPHLKEVA